MKKLFLIVLSATFLFTSSNAQIDIKVNPVGLLFNSPDFSGEYIVKEDIGIEVGLGLEYGNTLFGNLQKSGFNIFAAGKYYFNPNHGGDNFYAGIYLRPRQKTFTDEDNELGGFKTSAFAGGVMFGKKWVSSKNIVFELSLGLGRAFNNKVTYVDPNNDQSVRGLGLDGIFRFAVGYRLGVDK